MVQKVPEHSKTRHLAKTIFFDTHTDRHTFQLFNLDYSGNNLIQLDTYYSSKTLIQLDTYYSDNNLTQLGTYYSGNNLILNPWAILGYNTLFGAQYVSSQISEIV